MRIGNVVLGILAILVLAAGGGLVWLFTNDWAATVERRATAQLGQNVEIGALDLDWSWPPRAEARDVVVGDGGQGQPTAAIPRLYILFSSDALFDGVLTYRSLRLVDPVLRLPTGFEAGSGGSQQQQGQSGGFDTMVVPSRAEDWQWMRQVVIENARLVWDGGDGKTESAPLIVKSLSAAVQRRDEPIRVSADGVWRDEGFTASGTLGTLRQLTTGLEVPVELSVETGAANAGFRGRVQQIMALSGVEGRMSIQTDSIAKLSGLFGASLPYEWQLSGEGMLRQLSDGWLLEGAEGQLNEASYTGEALWREMPPGAADEVRVALAVGELDAATLFPSLAGGGQDQQTQDQQAKEQSADQQSSQGGGVIPDIQLPVPTTTSTRISAEVTVNRLHALKQEFGPIALSGRISPEGLAITRLVALLDEGRVAGSGSARQTPQGAEYEIHLGGAGIGTQWLPGGSPQNGQDPEVAMAESGSGEMAARIDLFGRGETLADLLGSADGRVALGIQNAGLGGKLMQRLAEALPAGGAAVPDRLQIQCMALGLGLTGGEAELRGLLLRTGEFAIGGTGRVGLDTGELGITLATPKGAEGGLPTLRLSGTLSDPSFATADQSVSIDNPVPADLAALLADPLNPEGTGDPARGITCQQEEQAG